MKKLAAIVVLIVALAGCQAGKNDQTKARNKEQAVAGQQSAAFLNNQPIPKFTFSQLRQNLIEIETSQAQTTQTTSFMFNQGVANPVTVCPSIGFPIPASDQLTNPEAKVQDHDVALPQLESNGVYTGDTTGTYVMCVDATGKPYAVYWEGFVQTVTGPAVWQDGQVKLVGAPSFDFSKGKK